MKISEVGVGKRVEWESFLFEKWKIRWSLVGSGCLVKQGHPPLQWESEEGFKTANQISIP